MRIDNFIKTIEKISTNNLHKKTQENSPHFGVVFIDAGANHLYQMLDLKYTIDGNMIEFETGSGTTFIEVDSIVSLFVRSDFDED